MKNNTTIKLTKLLFVTLTFILVISSFCLYAFANTNEDKLNININTSNLNTITTNTTIPDFIDVPKNFWGYADIMEMVNLGYLKGIGNGKFNPNGQVTYAEFLTMLANMFYEVEGYPNITNKTWYYDNVRWLGERGVTNEHIEHIGDTYIVYPFGGNSIDSQHYLKNVNKVILSYNQPIKRKNMALYMYNVAFNSIGQVRSLPKPDVLIYNREGLKAELVKEFMNESYYSANGLNPPHLKPVIEYNYKQGFLKGINASGEFGAERHMTRAEAATVLKRMYYASTERVQPTTFKEILVEHHYSTPNKKLNMRATNPDFQKNSYWAEYDILAVYIPGKLTNGKPNTPENREELLREIMESMPHDKHWADSSNFPDYENATFNDTIGLGPGGCNGYASFIVTALFGQYAPFKVELDTTIAKSGDIYDIVDKGKYGYFTTHYTVVTGKRNDGSQYDGLYYMTDGNNSGRINWDWAGQYGGMGEAVLMYPESALYVLDESAYTN